MLWVGIRSENYFVFFFFKQKTAYEIGTGDWSSDVCSSDLVLSANYIMQQVYQDLQTTCTR